MDEFTIWCTKEQTKLAMELGAPIILKPEWLLPDGNRQFPMFVPDKGDSYMVKVPTAEQMIGWLEGKESFSNICVRKTMGGNHSSSCYCNGKTLLSKVFSSREEATLAAIDAALKYLTTNDFIKA